MTSTFLLLCALSQLSSGAVVHASDAAVIEAAPAGSTIVLSADIAVDRPVKLASDNITFSGLGHTITQRTEDTPTLIVTGDGVSISRTRFVGLGTETPWADGATAGNNVAGIRVVGASDTRIRDCVFTRHSGGSIVLAGACSGVLIDGCTIRGMGAEVIANLDNGSDAAIKGSANSIAKRRVTITRCDISGHCFGLLIPGDCRMIVTNNHIHDIPGQHGMYFARGGDCVVANNLVTDCAWVGIKFQHQTADDISPAITITGNTVARCGYSGICVFAATGKDGNIRNVAVTSNSVVDCGKYGYYFHRCRNLTAMANRAADCEIGMELRDCSGTITPNAIYRCPTRLQVDAGNQR